MTVKTRDWNAQLTAWAQPPSAAEREKMERAEREIREAIRVSPSSHVKTSTVRHRAPTTTGRTCPERAISTSVSPAPTSSSPSGSWWTNAREPTRDIVAALDRSVGNFSLPYSFGEFKNEVGEALVTRFGPPPAVERGDKAYDIHETRYRVESDCLPSFELRLYQRDTLSRITHQPGIAFRPDKGGLIMNFPEQQCIRTARLQRRSTCGS